MTPDEAVIIQRFEELQRQLQSSLDEAYTKLEETFAAWDRENERAGDLHEAAQELVDALPYCSNMAMNGDGLPTFCHAPATRLVRPQGQEQGSFYLCDNCRAGVLLPYERPVPYAAQLRALLALLLPLLLFGCAEPRTETPTPVKISPPVEAPTAAQPLEVAAEPTLLGRFTTNFAYKSGHENRAKNIERIASILQRFEELHQIEPGDEWSFNVAVGSRSRDNGFLPAPAIFLGEVTDDVGGGTCQASSTIFAAAIEAGLDITERTAHSRPSKYIPKGLDATVSYPEGCDGGDCAKLDLSFKNPYLFAVQMKVEVGEPYADDVMDGALRGQRPFTVSFFGKEKGPKVEHRWIGSHEDASWSQRFHKTGRIRTATYKKRVQSGAPGLFGVLQVRRMFTDGHEDAQRYVSNYRPVDEVWEVGLDWDMANKPWD